MKTRVPSTTANITNVYGNTHTKKKKKDKRQKTKDKRQNVTLNSSTSKNYKTLVTNCYDPFSDHGNRQ